MQIQEIKNIKIINQIYQILKTKSKRQIQLIILLITGINLGMILISLFTKIFVINNFVTMIINSLIGIVNIILIMFLLKKNEEVPDENGNVSAEEVPQEHIETNLDFNPILLSFFEKSKIEMNLNLLLAECKSLEKRGLLKIKKTVDNVEFILENEQFIRMNGVEAIEESEIDKYSKNGIPAYENLFVTKIVFPFENTITLKDMNQKIKEGYYQSRLQMCEILLEEMLIHELEKNNDINTTAGKNNTFPIILIVNILVGLLSWAMLGIINIFLLAGMIANVGVSGLLLLDENVLSYNFSPQIREYIKKIKDYAIKVDIDREAVTTDDIILKLIFDPNMDSQIIIKYL